MSTKPETASDQHPTVKAAREAARTSGIYALIAAGITVIGGVIGTVFVERWIRQTKEEAQAQVRQAKEDGESRVRQAEERADARVQQARETARVAKAEAANLRGDLEEQKTQLATHQEGIAELMRMLKQESGLRAEAVAQARAPTQMITQAMGEVANLRAEVERLKSGTRDLVKTETIHVGLDLDSPGVTKSYSTYAASIPSTNSDVLPARGLLFIQSRNKTFVDPDVEARALAQQRAQSIANLNQAIKDGDWPKRTFGR